MEAVGAIEKEVGEAFSTHGNGALGKPTGKNPSTQQLAIML